MSDEKKKECFVIMPLTTPDFFKDVYIDKEEHFKHVLECLFVPSIMKAVFTPIRPIAKGSDLIHAEIIKNLDTADLVLCDMSCLNPNVFFEFGIRTSLNKPVSVVKDEFTTVVPFDTGILNHIGYNSRLEAWKLEDDIKRLAQHLTDSAEGSKGVNTLWRYFGLKSEAKPYAGKPGGEDKLDYLALQIDLLRQKVDAISKVQPVTRKARFFENSDLEEVQMQILKMMSFPAELESFYFDYREGYFNLRYFGNLLAKDMGKITDFVHDKFNQRIVFEALKRNQPII